MLVNIHGHGCSCSNIHQYIHPFYHRNIARFHTRSHKLEIEKRAWMNLSCHARVCRFCDLPIVETKAHVALQCPSRRTTNRYHKTLLTFHQFSPLPLFLYRQKFENSGPLHTRGDLYIVLMFMVPWVIFVPPRL